MLYIVILFSLIDINECRSAKLVCHHYCTNTLGSYRCGCNDGFQLDTDQKTCNRTYIKCLVK